MRGGLAVFCLAMAVFPAEAQPSGMAERQSRGRAIEELAETSGDEPLRKFAEDHLAPAYRDSFATGALLEHLRAVRAACAGAGGVLAEPAGGGSTRLVFIRESGRTGIVFRLEEAPPHRIASLTIEPVSASTSPDPSSGRGAAADDLPITWETLGASLAEEEKRGFSGTVIASRGGKIVLQQGYGLANREKGIGNTTETIFAIGSMPIDFTKAAILRLEEMGRLRTSDLLSRFVKEVPADKRSITIDHLMTGRSGLPDFHHIRGVDTDFDLSWIDRDTAIRRLLGQTLLFKPGEDRRHSHSAWVLLAAVVEIVSEEPYGAFLKKQFFEMAGMSRTGLHEEAAGFRDEEFAAGYGGQAVGAINIPKHWGKTSWLVMGSGGMFSTPLDLHRWVRAIREGKTLSKESASKYGAGGVGIGGDDRGFFCLSAESSGDLVTLCSNAHRGPGDGVDHLGRLLAQLVRSNAAPPVGSR